MLPARADHARAALRLGLDMHAAAASVDTGDGRGVQVRVGMHSGAVTSGVIGHVRARFCLFGGAPRDAALVSASMHTHLHLHHSRADTVNTASRMESSGRTGCVQMSAAAYQATGLPPGAVPQRRVDVKGKGQMDTYVLDAASPEAAQVRALLDSDHFVAAGPAVGASAEDAAAEAAPADVPAGAAEDDEDGDLESEEDDAAAQPVAVSRTSTVLVGGAPVTAATQSPPSTMGSSAPAQDVDAATRVREAAVNLFMTQLFIAVGPSLMYLLLAVTDVRLAMLARAGFAFYVSMVATFSARASLPPAVRLALAPWWTHIALGMQIVQVLGMELVLMHDFPLRIAGPTCPDSRPSACIRVFYRRMHAPLLSLGWLMAQLPVTRVFFPEIVRNALYVGSALRFALADGTLTPWYAVSVAMEGMACALLTPAVLLLSYRAPESILVMLSDVETCPRFLRGYRAQCYSTGLALRRRYFGDAVLLDARTHILLAAYSCLLIFRIFIASPAMPIIDACAALTQLLAVLLLVSLVGKLKFGSQHDLDALAHEVKSAERAHALSQLRDRLAVAPSEAAILRAGCEAISDLFPGGLAYAMAAFAESSACSVVTVLHLLGDVPAQEALLSSLPSHVGAKTQAADSAVTSVARACQEVYGRPTVIDSREQPGGLRACSDWVAAVNAGLKSVHAVTAPLNAGHVVVVRTPTLLAAALCAVSDCILRALFRGSCNCTSARAAGRRSSTAPSSASCATPSAAPSSFAAPLPSTATPLPPACAPPAFPPRPLRTSRRSRSRARRTPPAMLTPRRSLSWTRAPPPTRRRCRCGAWTPGSWRRRRCSGCAAPCCTPTACCAASASRPARSRPSSPTSQRTTTQTHSVRTPSAPFDSCSAC
jgi:hypothetical protein